MNYTNPILYKINAFDVNNSGTINKPYVTMAFTYPGDNIPQTIETTISVYDNNTDTLVGVIPESDLDAGFILDLVSSSEDIAVYSKLLPYEDLNILNDNNYYLILTFEDAGNVYTSNPSIFKCYTTPEFVNVNIQENMILNQSSFKLTFDYFQENNILLNWYKCDLYNREDILIYSTNKIYDNEYDCTFEDLVNNTSYYIIITGSTVDGFEFNLKTFNFQVSFSENPSSTLIALENIEDQGYIKITTNYEQSTDITNISNILIKRKAVQDIEWITLVNVPIETVDDLNIEHHDYFNRCGVTYIYALVQIDQAGNESSYEEQTIESCFNKTFIVDASKSYDLTNGTNYNSYQRNQQTGIYETFGRKYPLVVMNSDLDYDSMTTDAYLIQDNTTNDFDYLKQTQYVREFNSFLNNKKAKILKDFNGNIWLISINNSIPVTPVPELGNSISRVSFSWVEIGDANNEYDLKNTNLIPVKPIYSQTL